MADGSKNATWKYIYKAVSNNPDVMWESLYKDPRTQKQLKEMYHLHGVQLATDLAYDMFVNIKKSFGYIDEGEVGESDLNESAEGSFFQSEREYNQTQNLVRNICRRNANNPRYTRRNIADPYSR